MRVNSVEGQNFKGKIKVNASYGMAQVFQKKIETLKNACLVAGEDCSLKMLANKMSGDTTYMAPIQKDGFYYILTDDDAKKAKNTYVKSLYHIYKKDQEHINTEELQLNRYGEIAKIVDEAQLIGEINCQFEVIV